MPNFSTTSITKLNTLIQIIFLKTVYSRLKQRQSYKSKMPKNRITTFPFLRFHPHCRQTLLDPPLPELKADSKKLQKGFDNLND